MIFSLSISLNDEAAQENPGYETAKALESVAVLMRQKNLVLNVGAESGRILDGNGNTIGHWNITGR